MCLPSLDDLLADYPATVPDDGLFSGFQSLDNQGLDLLALPDESATQSHQHSNNMSGRTSEDHSYSAGLEGKLSTAAARLNSVESTPGFPGQQPEHRTPVQSSIRVISAPTTAGSMPSAPPPLAAGQGASPSLVGMTAAQVAEALGYTSQPADAQQAQGLSNVSTVSKQPAVRRQANGKKKRGRDAETPHPVAAVRDASEQQAVSSQAAEVASRAGSPGVSSSNDASQADLPHEHSSGQSAAGDDEEQKRMVGLSLEHVCIQLELYAKGQNRTLSLLLEIAASSTCAEIHQFRHSEVAMLSLTILQELPLAQLADHCSLTCASCLPHPHQTRNLH